MLILPQVICKAGIYGALQENHICRLNCFTLHLWELYSFLLLFIVALIILLKAESWSSVLSHLLTEIQLNLALGLF